MAKAHTLQDNFNDNVIDSTRWTWFGGSEIQEVNGRIEIRLGTFPNSSTGAGYVSAAAYDLTGSEARIELVQAPRHAPGILTFLLLETNGPGTIFGGSSLFIGVNNQALSIRGSGGVLRELPYDEALHRWLRIRELGGTIYWETSPDGERWTAQFAAPQPFGVTQLYVKFGEWSWQSAASPGLAVFDNFNTAECGNSRRVEERRLSARDIRVAAAELAAERRHSEHVNNNDDVPGPWSPPLAGVYSKSLKHDSLGDPDPVSYATLLRAIQSQDPQDFEEIQLASSTAVKLTNPQAGLTFDTTGPDAQELALPPAPRFESFETGNEMGELYWMALARDVHFADYGSDPVVTAAINSLNAEFPQFGGTVPVTAQNVFRGIYPGEQVGPYVSQFMWKGNNDPRKPDGLGRDANEGFISYGSRVIDQRLIPAAAGVDYLADFSSWLDVQNGVDRRGQDTFDTTRRFIRNLRDGATFVHFDQVIDAFYNAAWILMSEPMGDQLSFQPGVTGRPMLDLEFPKDQGNPYDPPGTTMDSKTQVGFGTFGPIHLLQVLGEVLGRAIRAVWWQKWGVHRRLRPEEYGGRIHNHVTGARYYLISGDLAYALQSGGLSPYYGQAGERFPNSYLLPQGYPEGAPTHPAYGAGHATGAGALATMLKAFFDETAPIENPVIASPDGLSLLAYTGADAAQMTVGGELNKLAGNIALFRNAAGVHWRSDYTESLPFGEAIAIRMLQEMSLGFNEDDAFFELTRFDGQKVRIFDGKVVPVPVVA
jgi:hypothetical protein